MLIDAAQNVSRISSNVASTRPANLEENRNHNYDAESIYQNTTTQPKPFDNILF